VATVSNSFGALQLPILRGVLPIKAARIPAEIIDAIMSELDVPGTVAHNKSRP
jgi:hypothetical protein